MGDDIFVHIDAAGGQPLNQGDQVEYSLGADKQGRSKALDVKVIPCGTVQYGGVMK